MVWLSEPGFRNEVFVAAGKRKGEGYMSGYEGHSHITVTRGKKMKVTFKAKDGNADAFEGRMIPVSVDGEPMEMERFHTIEVIPDGIEYMFDPRYFDHNNWFN